MSFDARQLNGIHLRKKRKTNSREYKFIGHRSSRKKGEKQIAHISFNIDDDVANELNKDKRVKEMKTRFGTIGKYINYLLKVDLGMIEDVRKK